MTVLLALASGIIAKFANYICSDLDQSHKKAQFAIFLRGLIALCVVWVMMFLGSVFVGYGERALQASYYYQDTNIQIIIGNCLYIASMLVLYVGYAWLILCSTIGLISYINGRHYKRFMAGFLVPVYVSEEEAVSASASASTGEIHSSASASASASQASRKPAIVVYALYFIGFIFGITALAGLIMSYIKKDDKFNSEVDKTHYEFLISTFWRGLVYLIVGTILCAIFIGVFVLIYWFVWSLINLIQGITAYNEGRKVIRSSFFGFAKFE